MRKGFDGLSALVVASGLDVFSGHLFAFVSRRGDRAPGADLAARRLRALVQAS